LRPFTDIIWGFGHQLSRIVVAARCSFVCGANRHTSPVHRRTFQGVEPVKPLRLVFVTRRFWPLVGGSEKLMANLAVELAGRGCRVTILTARWQPNWPARITFHELPVVRLPHPPQDGWKTFRYTRALARWLKQHQDAYDLVYVSGLRHEAYAALRALRGRLPVVLRAERAGRWGDCLWQIEASCGRRIKQRCMGAAAFVGPSRAAERELQAAGYPRPRIHYLPNSVPIPPPRSPTIKAAARAVLRDASPVLEIPQWAPLALYSGPLHPNRGLKHLVAAWGLIVARWRHVRLWLAGDGPDRAALQGQIEAMNLTHRVMLIGVFDTVDELLSAADLFVLPSLEGGGGLSLLEAMAAGLAIVAGDTPGNRAVLSDGREGLLVPAADRGALSAAIARLLQHHDLAARLGAAARQRAADEFALAKTADAHITLFQRLADPDLTATGPGKGAARLG
jgi:glycosyltransferase involved in cell wall biosynthesis